MSSSISDVVAILAAYATYFPNEPFNKGFLMIAIIEDLKTQTKGINRHNQNSEELKEKVIHQIFFNKDNVIQQLYENRIKFLKYFQLLHDCFNNLSDPLIKKRKEALSRAKVYVSEMQQKLI